MKSKICSAGGLFIVAACFVGCLQTRNDVHESEQRNVMQQQVSSLQKTNADVGNRFSELEEEIRALNGRMEVAENKQEQSHSVMEGNLKSSKQQGKDLNEKLGVFQEALEKMEKQIENLTSEVQSLKAKSTNSSGNSEEPASPHSSKGVYEAAQSHFSKKEWKQCILKFEKYREGNPKGSHFSEATYKIGVAFQELGMVEESKTFFDEVIKKFPKSEDARRAKIRLKTLKK